MKRTGLIFLLLVSGSLIGCGIAIPVHQDHTSQSLGAGVLEASVLAIAPPQMGPTPDQIPANTNFSGGGGAEPAVIPGTRVAFGILPKLDVEAEFFPSYYVGYTVDIALKYQWYGPSFFEGKPGDLFLGTRVRYAHFTGYEDEWTGAVFHGNLLDDPLFARNLSGDGWSIATAWGYQPLKWLSTEGGIEFGGAQVSGLADNGFGNATATLFNVDRSGYFAGPFGGVSMFTTGDRFRFMGTMTLAALSVPETWGGGNTFFLDASGAANFVFNFH